MHEISLKTYVFVLRR